MTPLLERILLALIPRRILGFQLKRRLRVHEPRTRHSNASSYGCHSRIQTAQPNLRLARREAARPVGPVRHGRPIRSRRQAAPKHAGPEAHEDEADRGQASAQQADVDLNRRPKCDGPLVPRGVYRVGKRG
ncbi:hypothetical protein NQ176_g10379 [Zarea fungicola]|uniref:Uncharacterized protein n=1 Tax=Zarea fungicola TaxID=93591 RepID=A0ACC1MG76_9HYPO|nr:hypothetical protein NQ176_g10379 [Lecanicillium fungicola]